MNKLKDDLKRYISVFSPSGREEEFALFLKKELSAFADSISIDAVGNFIAKKGKPEVIITAHMDSVGFMVKRVFEEAVEVVKLGDPSFENHARVVIAGKKKVEGILMKDEKEGLFVETGIKLGKVVKKGDFVCYKPVVTIQRDIFVSPQLDNKIGCLVGAEVFKKCSNVAFIATTHEESDGQGAYAVLDLIRDEKVVICDTTYAEDDIALGSGPAVCLKDKFLHNRKMTEELIKLAKENKIKCQIEVSTEGDSDARAFINCSRPISFVFVGVPIKFAHSPFEFVCLKDIAETIKLFTLLCKEK